MDKKNESEETVNLQQAVAHYNKATSNAIGAIGDYIGVLDQYAQTFKGQQELLTRLGMAKRVALAAISQFNSLRPKFTMISEVK